MADIYQQIWDADQESSGVPAVAEGTAVDPARGYVRVSMGPATPQLRLLPEVHIPDAKAGTYRLVKELFDNYALSERAPEVETPEEREEVHELLNAVVDTPPMRVARDFVQQATGTTVTKERWYATLLEQWFRQFSQGGDPMLTGFEHVFVGEQEGPKVQGYHFWYKYYLDDGFATQVDGARFPNLQTDRIEYIASKAESGQERFPESVTISYKWLAPDYDAGAAMRPLTKKIGGFFVGCSVEGLMAMGAVRAHLGARAPKEAVINGARYNLKLFRSDNNAHVRTFYPVFLGPAGDIPLQPVATPTALPLPSVPTTPSVATAPFVSGVRIVAALVNPVGDDPGQETVTLVNTSPLAVSLVGCAIRDKNGNATPVNTDAIAPGAFFTLVLPRLGGAQLANKGGQLRLVDSTGRSLDEVSYTKAQAQREGELLLFS